MPSRPRPTPRSASYALLSTRQGASAFNQPLSFDTSSVTTMHRMFAVRSAHALAPQHSQPDPLAVHAARALPPAHALPPPSAQNSPRIAHPPFDSAGCDGVQPAAQLRHVQRHGHEPHVPRALRACPSPPASTAGPSPHACRSYAAAGQCPPAPGPHLARHRTPSFRLGRSRGRSTSRWASTRPASRTCAACSTCAPRMP